MARHRFDDAPGCLLGLRALGSPYFAPRAMRDVGVEQGPRGGYFATTSGVNASYCSSDALSRHASIIALPSGSRSVTWNERICL